MTDAAALITPDVDETARLILMDGPRCLLPMFIHLLRRNTNTDLDMHQIAAVWRRYRGSPTTQPTHDVLTGQEL